MSLKKYTGGAWNDTEALKRNSGGAWQECEAAKRWNGSAWVPVWENYAYKFAFLASDPNYTFFTSVLNRVKVTAGGNELSGSITCKFGDESKSSLFFEFEVPYSSDRSQRITCDFDFSGGGSGTHYTLDECSWYVYTRVYRGDDSMKTAHMNVTYTENTKYRKAGHLDTTPAQFANYNRIGIRIAEGVGNYLYYQGLTFQFSIKNFTFGGRRVGFENFVV